MVPRTAGVALLAFISCILGSCDGYSLPGRHLLGSRLRIRVSARPKAPGGEPWRHEQALPGPGEGTYFSDVTVNRPLWGVLKMFEEQQLEGLLSSLDAPIIMELGCGDGRALLELQVQFPAAKLICLTLTGYQAQLVGDGANSLTRGSSRSDNPAALLQAAKYYGIPWHPDTHRVPELIHADLPQDLGRVLSESVDVAYSLDALASSQSDVELLGQLARMLKPHGQAFIRTADMQAEDCPQLAHQYRKPLTLMCKRLKQHGKCLSLVAQNADIRRFVGKNTLDASPVHLVELVDDCGRRCDDEGADAIDQLSYFCGSHLSDVVSTKLRHLAAWDT